MGDDLCEDNIFVFCYITLFIGVYFVPSIADFDFFVQEVTA